MAQIERIERNGDEPIIINDRQERIKAFALYMMFDIYDGDPEIILSFDEAIDAVHEKEPWKGIERGPLKNVTQFNQELANEAIKNFRRNWGLDSDKRTETQTKSYVMLVSRLNDFGLSEESLPEAMEAVEQDLRKGFNYRTQEAEKFVNAKRVRKNLKGRMKKNPFLNIRPSDVPR